MNPLLALRDDMTRCRPIPAPLAALRLAAPTPGGSSRAGERRRSPEALAGSRQRGTRPPCRERSLRACTSRCTRQTDADDLVAVVFARPGSARCTGCASTAWPRSRRWLTTASRSWSRATCSGGTASRDRALRDQRARDRLPRPRRRARRAPTTPALEDGAGRAAEPALGTHHAARPLARLVAPGHRRRPVGAGQPRRLRRGVEPRAADRRLRLPLQRAVGAVVPARRARRRSLGVGEAGRGYRDRRRRIPSALPSTTRRSQPHTRHPATGRLPPR